MTLGGGFTWLYEGNVPVEDNPGIGGELNGKYTNANIYFFSLYLAWGTP